MKSRLTLGTIALTLLLASCGQESAESAIPEASKGLAPFHKVNNPIQGMYIVKFRDGAAGSKLVAQGSNNLIKNLGLHPKGVVVKHVYSKVLNGFSGKLSSQNIAKLRANKLVEYIEQDGVVKAVSSQSNATWGLDRIDQRDLPLNKTYNYQFTGQGVTAYVIDTGIHTTHSEFGGRARWGTNTLDSQDEDCHGHGTHVAGTVGGKTYGVAKDVKLVGIKVLNCKGRGANSAVVKGIEWAVSDRGNKPAVANLSLVTGASSAVDDATRNAIKKGLVMVVASGNKNRDACNASPARTKEAITVNASDKADKRSTFSNYGKCTDIFAPGTSITSAWKDSDTATRTISGTSMAAPHVAGGVALLLEANTSAKPQQIADILYKNAITGKITNPGAGSTNRLLFTAAKDGGDGGQNKAPKASFTYNRKGLRVSLKDQSTDPDGRITKWNWDFGNGKTSNKQNPTVSYRAKGTYKIQLTVTDNGGKTNKTSQSINVSKGDGGGDDGGKNKAPVANFSFDGDGLKMKFFDKSTDSDGKIAKWAWDFGNGYDDEIANPELNYRGPGTFNIKLTVTDDKGATASKTRKIKIKTSGKPEEIGGTPDNQAPISKFSYSQNNLSVQFSDESSDPDGKVTKWAWDFGDGKSSTDKSPAHTYKKAGTYTVKLIVTDNKGAKNSSQQTIKVGKADPNNKAPVADFGFSGNGLSVKFADKSTDADGKIVKWDWDFDNGYDADIANPKLNYRGPGIFYVRLTVTDDDGATATKTRRIKVSNSGSPVETKPGENTAPTPYFTYKANGLKVSFKDGSYDGDGNIVKWIWDFGNGETSDQREPIVTYAKKGEYKVKLTVTDNKGATNSFNRVVKVDGNVKDDVKAAFKYSRDNLSVKFQDQSKGAVKWAWNFGNGETSSKQNPTINYRSKGDYTVKLTVTGKSGLTNSTSQVISISKGGGGGQNKAPVAKFTYTKKGLRVNLKDQSTDSDGRVVKWAWNFGNGETSSKQNPTVNYRSKGTYTIKLTVTDDKGANHVSQQSVEISKGGTQPNPNPSDGVYKGELPAQGAFYAPNEAGFKHAGGQLSATITKPNNVTILQLQQYRFGIWVTRKTDSGKNSINYNAKAGHYRWVAKSYGAGGQVTITINKNKRR